MDTFTHYRELGDKVGELYPNIRWSDILLQNTPLEKRILLEMNDDFILQCKRQYQEKEGMIQKPVDKSISVKDQLFPKYHSHKKTKKIEYMKKRERFVPKHKKKKYPTKPKNHGKIHRNLYHKNMIV